MLDILLIAVLLVALVNTNQSIARKFGVPEEYKNHLNYLLFYHFFFSLFYTYYILNFGGDSWGYWEFTMEQVVVKDPTWMKYFGVSTTFILWVNYIPSKIFGLAYITGNILYGFLGFIGIRYLFVMTCKHFPTNYKFLNIAVFPTIFYLPNMHFWSSGVGKDALCFWGIAWFVFAIQNYKERWWQGAIALFFVYYARPHMGLAMLGGATMAIILDSEIKRQYKFALFFLTMGGAIYFSDQTLMFLGMEDFSFESIELLAESQIEFLNRGRVGSAVDLASYSLPMRVFTYLYRPLFFDAHNFVAFVSSFENLFYLFFTFFLLRNFSLEAFRDAPVFLKASIFMFIPVTFAFASSLSNMGITMRMKNMTIIYLILFIFYLMVYKKKIRFIRHKANVDFMKEKLAARGKKKENTEA
ncbi:MAG: hypothetical protein WD426_01035 [Anditalea sp.]